MPDNKVRKRADRYVVRMFSGEWTKKDDAEVAAWQEADPRHAEALAASLEAWAAAEWLADHDRLIDRSTLRRGAPDGRYTSYSPVTRRTMFGLAAAVLAGVGIGLAFGIIPLSDHDASLMRLETGVGQQVTETLPDGSVVTLNTDSAVIVDYSDARRRLILDQGEAFFEVKKDEVRPFTVEVGSRSITVVGTKFSVRQVPGYDLTVAVVEGSVAVHRRDDRVTPALPISRIEVPGPLENAPDQYRLEAGAMVRLTETGPPEVDIDLETIESYSSWRKGYVRFDGVPLHEVVREINRYTDRKVIVEDPGAVNLEVNAVLHLDRLDVIFDGLEGTLPVQVTRTPNQVVIRRRD